MTQKIYTEVWKKLLCAIAKNQNFDNPISETYSTNELFGEIDSATANSTGQMISFTGRVIFATGNELFESLCSVYEENNDLKNAFPGELQVSKFTGDKITVSHRLVTVSDLIERYREEQMPKNLKEEIYKFELLKQFGDKWTRYESKTLSFVGLMESYPFGNLINTQYVPSIFNHVMQDAPADWEQSLLALYNEEEPLAARIQNYQSGFKELYFSLPKHGVNHGQEERTIATLLAFRYPDKYALFKDGFYTPLCKGMGIKPKSAGQKLLHYYDEIVPKMQEALLEHPDIIEWKNQCLKGYCYPDNQNTVLAQDVMYTTVNSVNPYRTKDHSSNIVTKPKGDHNTKTPETMHPLNTILYGPPGTGKTYNSINHALSIIEGKPLASYEQENREEVKKRFDALLMKGEQGEGQIGFITFHQSLSYEDFVEGIKPVAPEDTDAFLKYEVQPGILKRIAELARYKPDAQTEKFSIPESDFEKAMFYKMSLGRANNEEDEAIYRWCMDNGYIALGWGDDIDFSNKSEVEIRPLTKENGLDDFHGDAIKRFVHWIHDGDYVLISEGNRICRAIGRVTSSYEFKGESPIPYHQFRKVEWLLKDVSIPVEEIYGRAFSMMSIYQLDKGDLKKDFFLKAPETLVPAKSSAKPYVLIIDEINRGNVSQIFGELITLIEDGKREGQPEALSTILPYSRERFSVPPNLYIIGTMNTADRSVEALDTALRRRFEFEHKGPIYNVLGLTEDCEGVNLKHLLEKLNHRLEILIDEDHTIGHAWLLNVKTLVDLKAKFKSRILPLLQEYFYNDFEKLGRVLGNRFFLPSKHTGSSELANFTFGNEEVDDYADALRPKLKPVSELTKEDFQSIYTTLPANEAS